jgi:hypothetical protein
MEVYVIHKVEFSARQSLRLAPNNDIKFSTRIINHNIFVDKAQKGLSYSLNGKINSKEEAK